MKRYFFKTRGREPDEECTERCMVKNNGTMIGSLNCLNCLHNKGNDHEDGIGASWIMCERLEEAIQRTEQTEKP